MSRWDAICVGAGITSLAFAAHVLARRPRARLLVVDKHAVPGGYASVFRRPKASASFDCSLHKLSGVGEGGNMRRMFEALGLQGEIELKRPGTYFEACFGDRTVVLPNDEHAVVRALIALHPEESAAIHAFFDEVNVYGRLSYYQFQMMEGSFEADFAALRHAHRHLRQLSVAEALSQRFRSPALADLLGVTGMYVGGHPEDLGYLYFLHVVYATLCKGNAYVRGASQHLSDTLARRVREAGGEVLLDTTVTRIATDGQGRAVGIDTRRGSFASDRIYVNAAPHHAVRGLFDGGDAVMAPVVDKLKSLRPSRATTTLYLTTDRAPSDLGLASCETILFAAPFGEALAARAKAAAMPSDAAVCEAAYWSASPVEVTNYHALDAAGGRVVCLNVLDDIGHWPARRDPAYKAKKQRAADVLLGRLLAARPGLAGHVLHAEVSSPRTYERFTNNTDGAGYGAMVGTDLSGHLFHRDFPVAGVHFLSAWVAGPSYEAAFGYAEMKAREWERSVHHEAATACA